MYLQVILNLLLVIVVIAIYLFINWKIKTYKTGKGQSLEVLAMLPLGAKEKILIIRAESKKLLVGVTPGGVTILCDMSDNHAELEINYADFIEKQALSKELQ